MTKKKKNILTRTAGIAAALLLLSSPLGLSAATLPADNPMTLEKAISLVRENNPSLKAAADDVTAAESRVAQSRSAYFPQISASAGYTYLDPVSEMELPGIGSLQFMPHDNYDAKVTARATLFDAGKRGKTVDLALSGRNSARHSLDLAHRDLSYQTVQLFYGRLFLQESLRVEEKEITALSKALDFATKRYQSGTATRFDLLSTEVRIAAARSRMLDIEHALRRNELTLRRLTGIADSSPLMLAGSFAVTPPAPAGTGLVAQALHERPELKLLREQENAAKQKRALAVKGGMPVVTGTISYGITTGMMPDIYEKRNNLSAGLHLEIPLFTGFRNSAERQETTALLRAAAERRLDSEQQVKADVLETLHAQQTATEKIRMSAAQVEQAGLAAEHARARYSNGMATTLDLLDTEASLSQAELGRLQAVYEYVMNNYTLKRATGEIFW